MTAYQGLDDIKAQAGAGDFASTGPVAFVKAFENMVDGLRADAGAGVVELTAHTKSLEEIFLSLTQTREVK